MRGRSWVLVGLTLVAWTVLSLLLGAVLSRSLYETGNDTVAGGLQTVANQMAAPPRTDKDDRESRGTSKVWTGSDFESKSKPRREGSPMAAVLTLLAVQPSFSVVQIGAYVGDTPNDPLYPFLCTHLDPADATEVDAERTSKVILVEPIREYFDLLCKNYSRVRGIEFENVAIAETDGEREIYRLNVNPVEYGYPEWLAQLGSLKRERTEEMWGQNEKMPDMQRFYLKHRIVEKVKCMTLQQLFDKHEVRQLDLLEIDTEGYDYEILKTLDFDKIKPRFINYERVLLQEDEPACRKMLSAQGYQLIDWGQDTLCIYRGR